jgi:dihydrofolate reductase
MRKLRLQMQVSVDGFVASGPDDDQQWVTWAWDEIRGEVMEIIAGADTILLGRRLAEGYIPYWVAAAEQRDAPMYDLARRVTDARKIVFTKTLTSSPWPGSSLATGDVAAEIAALKQGPGSDLVVYGGSSFVSALIEGRLIDEYNLFVNPVALGRGVPIFARVAAAHRMRLIRALPYPSGIVLLTYQPL